MLTVNAKADARVSVRALALVFAMSEAACASVVAPADASADHADAVVDVHDGNCTIQYCLPGYECVRDYVPADGGFFPLNVCRGLPSSCVLPRLSQCVRDALGRCDCPDCAARLLCPESPCHIVPISGPNNRVECSP